MRETIASASLLQDERPLVIAVSGGSDSLSLLHILSSLYPHRRRIVVYVDHGLRPDETIQEIELVQQQSEKCGGEFVTVTVDVQAERSQKKYSPEEAARSLRYRALADICERNDACAIAVGHTADDQAEEILLRLIRGSGRSGLSGMRLKRGNIIRPLLGETKETLVHYLREKEIPFCLDSSNKDLRFLRNRIRLHLLPELEKSYNPSIRRTLLQSGSILGEEELLLSKLTEEAYRNCVRKESEQLFLNLMEFPAVPRPIQRRVLEKICWNMGSRPTFQKIAALMQLSASRNNREIHLAAGLRALRQGDELLFLRPSRKPGYRGPAINKKTFAALTLPGPGSYPVPELNHELILTVEDVTGKSADTSKDLSLDMACVTFPLILRPPVPGDRFHPHGAPGRKKVSRFLSDHKIPAAERCHYPVLLSEETIVALVPLRISDTVRTGKETKRILTLQWKELSTS